MRGMSFNEGWQVRPKVNRFAELAGQAAEWAPVLLPHDALIGSQRSPTEHHGGGYFPSGTWEYRKILELAAEDEGDCFALLFEGVYRDAVVTVNGDFAAHRPYGYSEFFVQIDHLLRYGQANEIRVDARAHLDSRWYSGAGIYRNVWLLRGGRVHLEPDALVVGTPEIDDDGAVLSVSAVLRNQSISTSRLVLAVEVLDASGAVVAQGQAPVTSYPGDVLTIRRRLLLQSPRRWSPDDPYLYTCRVSLLDGDSLVDDESTAFGVRSLALDAHRGLRINGAPVLLRGACVHHDNGVVGAATFERAEERRVELLKAAGFNALRSAHQPMSRAMLAACDRLGMLVMDETFDMWRQSKTDDDYAARFPEWWAADVEAMVRKDVNHPSVVMYSIGNEIPDNAGPGGVLLGRALAERVRALDGTRYVTHAVTGILVGGSELAAELGPSLASAGTDEEMGVNTAATALGDLFTRIARSRTVTEKTAEPFSYLDVCGYNYMDARFELDAQEFPDRVIVATETYPPAIDSGWDGVLNYANVIGDFTWAGWDYLGEVGIGRVEYGDERTALGMSTVSAEYPWLAAWCGDLDITGHRRPQSYYREIVFGLRREPYIAVQPPKNHGRTVVHASPWAWSDVLASWTWPGFEDLPVRVEVYCDSEEVELLMNDRSLGRRPAGAENRFRAEFETTFEPGQLAAVAWRSGQPAERTVLKSATGSVQLQLQVDRTVVAASPDELAFVEVHLTDEHGTIFAGQDREITVAVDGPAVLQGLGSANPQTEESFTGATCTTFHGRALAVVRPTGAGVVTVTVSADGCEESQVRFEAQQQRDRP